MIEHAGSVLSPLLVRIDDTVWGNNRSLTRYLKVPLAGYRSRTNRIHVLPPSGSGRTCILQEQQSHFVSILNPINPVHEATVYGNQECLGCSKISSFGNGNYFRLSRLQMWPHSHFLRRTQSLEHLLRILNFNVTIRGPLRLTKKYHLNLNITFKKYK